VQLARLQQQAQSLLGKPRVPSHRATVRNARVAPR
jgi:hypothetical protein